jgi:hypothetical protein
MTDSSGFDLNKLTLADKVLGGSGLVFLISTFLDWFKVSIDGDFPGLANSFGAGSGWDVNFLWGRLPFFITLGMLVWVGLRTFAPQVNLPAQVPALFLVGGGLVAALVTLKLLIGESVDDGLGFSIDRTFGLIIATLAALGVGFGSFLKFTEVGGKPDEVQSQLKQVSSQVTAQVSGAAKSAVNTAKTAVDTAKETTKNPDFPGDRPPPPPPPSQPL